MCEQAALYGFCPDMQFVYAVRMDKIVTDHALSLTGTYMTEQWMGSHVFKVGTRESFKMFAILLPGKNSLTVKAPDMETCQLLFEAGVAEKNAHLPRGNWMVLHLDKLDVDDVTDRITASYETVFPTLPKRVRDALEKG